MILQTLHNIADCRTEHEWTMGWLGKYWGCDKIVGGRTLKAMKQSHAHIFQRLSGRMAELSFNGGSETC